MQGACMSCFSNSFSVTLQCSNQYRLLDCAQLQFASLISAVILPHVTVIVHYIIGLHCIEFFVMHSTGIGPCHMQADLDLNYL